MQPFLALTSQFEKCWTTAYFRQSSSGKCVVLSFPAQSSHMCPFQRRLICGNEWTPNAPYSHSHPSSLTCSPSRNRKAHRRDTMCLYVRQWVEKASGEHRFETRSDDADGAGILNATATNEPREVLLQISQTQFGKIIAPMFSALQMDQKVIHHYPQSLTDMVL